MGAPRKLNESNAPSFRKTLTSAMLKKSERVVIPKMFVHEHGDRLHRVLSLTGLNGKSQAVTLTVRGAGKRVRVTYLGREWIRFARENGFQMGDEVIFSLVASSSFRVALCSPQSLEKATPTRTNSSKGDKAGGTSDAITPELAPQHPKLARQDLREGTSASITNDEEIQIPPCHVNSNTVESQEGIVSRAQFCDMGAPRKLNESNAPSFRKTLTSAMLKKSERVVIPKMFVHEHGDRLHRVLSLTGLNGKSQAVTLTVRGAGKRVRVTYLGRGWICFARENGFQMGDEVIFSLVASSSFRVALCSPQSLEKATPTRTNSSKGDEAGGTSDATTPGLAPQHPKLARQDLREGTSASITNDEEIQIPPCHVNSNTVESQVPTCHVEVVPPQKLTSNVRKEEFAKYPGLNSALSVNSRFPQFVKRLTACNLHSKHPTGPEMPVAFVEEHGDKVREHVTLLGPSDHLRVLKLQITTFAGRCRVYLSKGWKDFSLENGFSRGDVLLFSLVGMSTFVVKVFPGARRS